MANEAISDRIELARVRFDTKVRCSPGNKPCGRTCIPARYNCNIKDKIQRGRSKLSSPDKPVTPEEKRNRGVQAALTTIGALSLGGAALAGTAYVLSESRKRMAEGIRVEPEGMKNSENKPRPEGMNKEEARKTQKQEG